MFYAEAWALTHYLIFGPDLGQGKKMNEFLALLQTSSEQTKAFQQVFGDPKDLDTKLSEVRAQIRAANPWIEKNPPQTDEKTFAVRTLAQAENQG